ncbi:3-hydroxyacyl-CoA dehydrogenase NAD-binding domain-containing protein [Kocuria palustris]|uniref:3-hydroxyacyl-CoA dehydrogenase NAD-binding domain-containing protein n=1 Tax=Kocuria palustris TaxID=71999 RepID=UPI0011A7A412|nr:3-hydroxyacyl-CoA dehydrogenase NAD-binding domain-containing protein [Kocuria palustris]
MTQTDSAATADDRTMIAWERDDDLVVLTMDDPDAGVNTMNGPYQDALEGALARLEAERDSIAGVVLTSGKKDFFAGGDLKALREAGPGDAQEIFALTQQIKSPLRRLETLGLPVAAALNGSALGGGLEIALACHHRICAGDPRIRLGLPEVTLGLLPGAGGISRLTRMLGIRTALMDWILPGTPRRPEQALEAGVIDEIVESPEDLIPAAKRWLREHAGDETATLKPWDAKGFRIPGGDPSQPSFARDLPAFPARLRQQLKGADPEAPLAALSAAVEGAQVDFDTACRIESRYFTRLVTGPTSTAMIQAFHFDLQAARSGRFLGQRSSEPRTVSTVAVLGAGMMGAGIAYECARAGMTVHLKDASAEKAEKGRQHSESLLEKAVQRGRMTQDRAQEILGRIRPTAEASDLAGADAVIEAVFEDHALKSRVLAEVESVVGPETLLCSNTSTLPITSLQRDRERPADVIGLHFFSPVEKMKLVEIISGEQTSAETLARAYDLSQQIGKVAISVNDGRGFYTSRVFGTLLLEAVAMLDEGVDARTIERRAAQAGFPGTPLAMFDEISMNLMRHIRDSELEAARAEGRQRPQAPGEALVDRMVDEFSRPGRSAGAGFYDYPEEGGKRLWPGLREHFARGTQLPARDLQDRLLFRMALETAACFEEGVLTDTASANIGGLLGIGFPPTTGGPATFMTRYEGGLEGFVARADELAGAYGARFAPSDWLRERAGAGTLA